MRSTSVIVPWRSGGCPHREAAWQFVRESWESWDLFTADDGGEPFSRAASINQGVAEHPADVYVIADADTVTDAYQVQTAVELAAHSPGLVVAFDRFVYLTREGTEHVLHGCGGWERYAAWTLHDTVSSCVAISHETWEIVGGFPAQFRAWGYEDAAMEVACAVLAGPTRRLPGVTHHLWHPPERERPSENAERIHGLLLARDDPDRFRELMPASW